MSRPWQEFPSRRPAFHSSQDHQTDIYAGPEEYMEVGTRGFLVNTLLGKEEVGIDDAIDLLRQASIKLYGGIKRRTKKFEISDGYVKIDFMDPESVIVLPTPEGEEKEDEKEQNDEDAGQDKQNGGHKTEEAGEKVASADETGEGEKKNETDVQDEKTDGSSNEKGDKEDSHKKKKADGEVQGSKKDEEKRGESKHDVQWMQSCYKFKAYRTEIRNMMFVKSDVPDPVKVADAAMEIVIGRKTVTGDAVRQLLPVLGVCPYDCYQLEVMTRFALSPMFDESLEPKGFSVFLMDKLSDPGSDLLIETVRNTIWSINPSSWQASPLTEPDVVIRLEIIGKKLVLSCLTHFMRYRHYNPKLLQEVGVGEAEDDDGSWVPADVRKMQEMIRADRERKRELERKREEEFRRERERRREEAEVRRRERSREREERRHDKEREKRSKDEKKDEKNSEKEHRKDEERKKADNTADKDKKPEESQAKDQKSDEKSDDQKEGKKSRARKSASAESPPSKKPKVEESTPTEDEDAEKEENMDESEEGGDEDKKGTPKKGAKPKRGGRRKSKK